MKRLLNFLYFVGVSVLLFFCILSIGKGFYLDAFVRSPFGTALIVLLAIGTLLVIGFSDSVDFTTKDEEEPAKDNKTTLDVGNYTIEKKLIQKVLTDVIYQEDENIKVNYKWNETAVDITLEVKQLDNIKVADVAQGIEKELKVQLKEMFNIFDELDVRFTIVGLDVPVELDRKEDEEETDSIIDQVQEQENTENTDSESKETEA